MATSHQRILPLRVAQQWGARPPRAQFSAPRGKIPARTKQFRTYGGTARGTASGVLQKRTASRAATKAATDAKRALIGALREVQKAAKQKYGRTKPIALADYLVGKKLTGNQPNLAQTSQAIVDRLAADKLPGFTPVKVKAVGTVRAAWVKAEAEQGPAQSAAEDAAAEFKALLKTITDEKLAIQLAADAEWPHDQPDHAGVRKEFALPARRPATV